MSVPRGAETPRNSKPDRGLSMFTLTERDIARFWKKVERRGDDDCWLWRACIDTEGYGRFAMGRYPVKAHRISWQVHFGDIGEMMVLHRCDVRSCVNPRHLFLGIHSDNMRDMTDKGRKVGKSGTPKLSLEKARDIRRLRAEGMLMKELAARFGIDKSTVVRIVGDKRWRDVKR
jgi:hypothetical protein